jgi:hypothetical protein
LSDRMLKGRTAEVLRPPDLASAMPSIHNIWPGTLVSEQFWEIM